MFLWLVTAIAVGSIQLSLPPQKLKMQILVNKSCPILELKPLPSFPPGTRRGSTLGVTRGEGTSPSAGSGGEQGRSQTHPCSPAVPRWEDSSSGVILTPHPGDEAAQGLFLQPGTLKSLQEFGCWEAGRGSYVAGRVSLPALLRQ